MRGRKGQNALGRLKRRSGGGGKHDGLHLSLDGARRTKPLKLND